MSSHWYSFSDGFSKILSITIRGNSFPLTSSPVLLFHGRGFYLEIINHKVIIAGLHYVAVGSYCLWMGLSLSLCTWLSVSVFLSLYVSVSDEFYWLSVNLSEFVSLSLSVGVSLCVDVCVCDSLWLSMWLQCCSFPYLSTPLSSQ